jgi:hypothetical protein
MLTWWFGENVSWSGTRGLGFPSGFVNKTHFKVCLTEDPQVYIP